MILNMEASLSRKRKLCKTSVGRLELGLWQNADLKRRGKLRILTQMRGCFRMSGLVERHS